MSQFIDLDAKDGFRFPAYVAEPAGRPKGAIVVLQEIFGVNSHIRSVADGYAAAGYLAVAPATFHRVKPDVELGYTGDDMQAGSALKTAVEALPAPGVLQDVQAAVDYAMAQVGDSYVYGASGPDAFDCSGLTSMAWAAAGVALPRSSGAQLAGGGTPVSMSDLQPGDLVFYYSPVSHVAMYIGGGQIVHAANPGTGVAVAGVSSMPVSGAVRPG